LGVVLGKTREAAGPGRGWTGTRNSLAIRASGPRGDKRRRRWKKGTGVRRPAVLTGSSPGRRSISGMGRHTPVVPLSLPTVTSIRAGERAVAAERAVTRRRCIPGSRVRHPAPGPTEAPLRSSPWSGRPITTWPSEVERLYPGGRVVLVSRKSQHAAELGCTGTRSGAPAGRPRKRRFVS
jgi:hypothetical protein